MAGLISGATGSRRVWLLELHLGHVFRFCTETASVETLGGATHRYEEGLTDPGVELDLGAGRDEVTLDVEVLCGVDWARTVARGVPIMGRQAVLLRHELDTPYERSRVVLRGSVISATHGGVGQPLRLTVRRAMAEVAEILPAVQGTIDETTWPTLNPTLWDVPDDSIGQMYPVVIGSPGYNGSGDAHPGLQVYYAQFKIDDPATSYVVIADGEVAAANVMVHVFDEPNVSPLITTPILTPVSTQTDNLGRTVSVITLDSATDIVRDIRIFVGFEDAGGGGIRDRRGNPIRGAGSVLRWVLGEHLDYPVDWPRFEAIADRLDAYKVDSFLNQPTNLWEWMVQEVLPILPIELRESSAGLYPFLWRWDATARDAVVHLDASLVSGNVSRASDLATVAGEIYNEISIEYGPDSDESGWRFRKVATSVARATVKGSSPTSDSRIRGSSLLGDSQSVFGLRQLTLQMTCVWDHATAELILRDRIAAHGWPRRKVSYEGGERLESLSTGDVVTITDPELHLTSAVALVWAVVPSGESVTVELLLLDHPRQTFRATN